MFGSLLVAAAGGAYRPAGGTRSAVVKHSLSEHWMQRTAWTLNFGFAGTVMHVICWLIVLAIVWLMAVSTAL